MLKTRRVMKAALRIFIEARYRTVELTPPHDFISEG